MIEKPELCYDHVRRQHCYKWKVTERLAHREPVYDHTREYIESLEAENAKLRELLQRLLAEYRYLRVRPRKMYLQHEQRMRAIEDEMRELGVEVDE